MTNQNTMTCPSCGGAGWLNANEMCQVCRAAGIIPIMTRQPVKKKKKTGQPVKAARYPEIIHEPEYYIEPEAGHGTRQAVPIHLYIHGAGSVQPGSVQPGDNEYYQTCQAGTVRPEPEKTAQPEKKEGFSLASLAIIAFTIFVILCMAM